MKNIVSKNILLLLLLVSAAGCLKEPEPQACTYDPCSLKAPDAEIQKVQEYLTSRNISATKHCSGLFYTVENAGTGNIPEACSTVEARYKGMLTNGEVFDQNRAQFSLSQVIAGWTKGVPLIKNGGRIILYIPPALGYGSRDVRDPSSGALVIPANSILVFEIDLLAVY